MTSSVISDCYGKDSQGELIGSTAATESNGKLLTENQLKDSASYTNWKFGSEWKISEDGFRQGWKLQTLRRFLHIYIVLLIVLGSVRIAGEFFYINGQPGGIDITDDMISGFDNTTAGTKP